MEGEPELSPSATEIQLSTEKELPFCGICSVQFPSKKSFDKLYEQNHPEEKFICENCYKAFSSKFLLEKHSKKRNCKKKKTASSEFGDLHISVGNKQLNYKKGTGEKQFECRTCKKRFSSNSNFLNHIQKHTDDKKYVCHICQNNFQLKVYLKRHLRTHTGEKHYACEKCFRCFAKRAELNIHSLSHTNEKPYTCDTCFKKFRHIGSLKYHQFFIHTVAGRLQSLKCNICGTHFKERRALLRHKARHKKTSKPNVTQVYNSLVECTQDDIKHSNDEQVRCQDHSLVQDDTHPDRKPYVCHICQQCFFNEKSFQQHSDTHINKEIPFISSFSSCDINSERENLRPDFYNHVEGKFICDVCDEKFNSSDDLKIHFKMHTEQKYYVCEVCQLCFIDEDALRNHENIEKCAHFHTCKICGEKFVDKIELETHYRTHIGFANETSTCSSLAIRSDLDIHCTTPSNAKIKSNVPEKSSSFNDNLKGKAQSSVKDLPYNCDLCNKTFTNASDLKQHNVIHTEKEPHACVLCLEKFDEKLELESHVCKYSKNKKTILYTTLTGKQVKGYICSLCLKCFINFQSFQHHMFEHAKQHICKACGKRFFTADKLETHRLQSHKPPMHPCIVCKEKFADKNDLITHCFSHLESGVYFICGSCKQCFKEREDLQKHSPCFVKPETI